MSPDYAIGQRVGDYEVLGVLGAGGMGKVYRVRNTISERVEAMKILLPNLASKKELADRFLREIKVLASLDHPNIAAFRTALTLNDQLVMIMEYVEGVTLASRLAQGPVVVADAVNYADQVLAALAYAHNLGVIHRDIKPANMMLTPKGVIKLMDFGIARPSSELDDKTAMTVAGTTLGSLNYMPPEQVKGEAVDGRSDIYSLGVSLYELVTGQLPFRGDSGYALMAAQIKEIPKPPITVRPDLPAPLNEIILIALAKDPANRFQSADAFRTALKSAFGPAPMPVTQTESIAPAATLTGPELHPRRRNSGMFLSRVCLLKPLFPARAMSRLQCPRPYPPMSASRQRSPIAIAAFTWLWAVCSWLWFCLPRPSTCRGASRHTQMRTLLLRSQ